MRMACALNSINLSASCKATDIFTQKICARIILNGDYREERDFQRTKHQIDAIDKQLKRRFFPPQPTERG